MLTWDEDLKLAHTDLYLDSRRPQKKCFISHAHADHLAMHQSALVTPETAKLGTHRIGETEWIQSPFYTTIREGNDFRLTLLPAGHVLGSAMLFAEGPEGRFLYTGDFKMRPSLTVPTADPKPCDYLCLETTYGLPHFHFPPAQRVAEELCERIEKALRENQQPIVLGYSLGKAQEITRILTDAGFNVTAHGAIHSINLIYDSLGVKLGAFRRYAAEDFHGDRQIDLRERGVLIGPPQTARSAFTTRFNKRYSIMMSGWALLKGAQYRYGVDCALPLSDHADFGELLELVDRVRPKQVFTHHGYTREFAETLKARGIPAQPAKPEAQMSLFG